ncbi:shikimate dehydrogenase [Arthrobacter roseus]|uniref:shikimate dehydrogenase n=1 Tax=Arthrobacter roseus TaxID=136274 RepID=UPI0019654133|nr:shikimate dehydrogenase [Arthrobacter roseus]
MQLTQPEGRPFRAAVIGHPISHSRSPDLHRAAYSYLAALGEYEAVDVEPGELDAFLHQFRTDLAWRGLSVTMPHKRAVVAYLDQIHEPALTLGAVNTVRAVRTSDHPVRLEGYNTDVQGIVSALRFAGYKGAGDAVVLGGGGTAAAALSALAMLHVRSATLIIRNPDKADSLMRVAQALGVNLSVSTFDGALKVIAGATATISALPPRAADSVADHLLHACTDLFGKVLLDVAYDPWPSCLASVWEAQRGVTVSGLDMLVYQAAEQALLFTEAPRALLPGVINAMCGAVGAPRR